MGSSHQAAIDAASQKAFNSNNNQVRDEGSEENDKGIIKQQNGHVVPADVPVPVVQKQGQISQPGGIVCWERFLPVKTLRVLLVENDDSTRHVVTALLRNCSYEVITAANGLQAWKILVDLKNHIDLVLTEVVMPLLSGIGLLTKIMNHKTRKTVPVIMMSSNDSMGTVFKCLSKGAVDFLVKPIRKNELKNLWQHIWRRCHSSSGSGSESGIQTTASQKCNKTNSGNDSENNNRSTDNEENTSIGVNARDSSDNGSATESSWMKCAVEVESPKAMSVTDQQPAGPPDSTCAQAIYCNTWLPFPPPPPLQQPNDDQFMGKDLEIGVPGNLNISNNNPKLERERERETTSIKPPYDKTPNSGLKPEGMTDGSIRLDEQAADLIGSIAADVQTQNIAALAGTSEDKDSDKFTVLPSLELSLKRLRSAGDNGAGSSEDRKVLRRSDLSAFTRYHTSSAASNQVQTAGCGWTIDNNNNNNNHNTNNNSNSNNNNNNSSEAVKTNLDNKNAKKSNSNNNATLVKQGSNGSSNNNDMGSTTKNVFAARAGQSKEKLGSPSAVKNNQHTSAFHPVQIRPPAPKLMQEKDTINNNNNNNNNNKDAIQMEGQDQPREKEIQVQHHHHHHYYHHHHHHSMQQQEKQEQEEEREMKQDDSLMDQNVAIMESTGITGAPPVEGHAANYSINGSNSGSNHASNGQNGGSTDVGQGSGGRINNNNNDNKNNRENGNGLILGGNNEKNNGNESGSGVYHNRAAQREAALNKFRQKRKERNFGKKVRYQSRKRLADQRPRVRGQFVRQPARETER